MKKKMLFALEFSKFSFTLGTGFISNEQILMKSELYHFVSFICCHIKRKIKSEENY